MHTTKKHKAPICSHSNFISISFRKYPPGWPSLWHIHCVHWFSSSSVCREMRGSSEGFITLSLKGRFSTLCPVSQPSQPGPAPCPLSPHICKSLKLSGLDHKDRAGLCHASDSLPRLNLNGLETVSESTSGGPSSLPLTSSSSPLSSSEHWSVQYWDLGTAVQPI